MLSFQPERKKAIAYYRHSAEDKQENSVEIQQEHTRKFAGQHNLDLLHEEADEGKTGLLANRPGFDRIFNDWILNPEAPDFDYVLVYDVSRWGRFQDQDEAAYYEFRCKQQGKKVIYVSRGFPKEEQALISHLQTSIERYMAAEYSRQLSEKVFHGSRKVAEQGFSPGGTAPYGMVRVLLNEQHEPIGTLKKGEHKVIANQRVTLAPAQDETVKVIKRVYYLLTQKWLRPADIASELNKDGIPTATGKPWNAEKVVRLLTNETYIGTRLYNKTWGRLKQKKRENPRDEWVVRPNAFGAIIKPEVFKKAQEHLYWLLPSKWKRGVYKIRKSQAIIQQHLEELITSHGFYEPDSHWFAVRNIPIVYGSVFYREAIPHWCFVLTEKMRAYDYVIGVSVAVDRREPLERFFLIPTKDFMLDNSLVLFETHSRYSDYLLPVEKVEPSILEVYQQALKLS